MDNSKFALQLSTREGFEVKVSEALHAGKPVIASRTGGIPLQIVHGKSGYLVDVGDNDTVAKHMFDLYTNDDLYDDMCEYAKTHVSDEVGTVGNALGWYYLAAKWLEVGVKKHDKGGLDGNEKWVNDMAREEAGHPYSEKENRLPRHFTEVKTMPVFTSEKAPEPKVGAPV